MLKKTLLAAAMLAGLYSTSAFAAVTLNTSPADAVKLAKELTVPAAGLLLDNTTGVFTINVAQGFNMSAGEVRYARLECDTNIKFDGAQTVTATNGALLGAVNGVGTSAISFSVTAPNVPAGLPSTTVFTIAGNKLLTTMGAANCSFSLYDQPSQASTGGTTGRINLITDAYLTPTAAVSFKTTPQNQTATVNAVPAFSKFDGAVPATRTWADLGAVTLTAGGAVNELGATITTANVVGTGSSIYLDLMGGSNGPGKYYLNANCSVGSAGAGSIVVDAANKFAVDSTNFNTRLCYSVSSTNTAAIPVAAPMLTLQAKPALASLAATNYGPAASGKILHDGTTLQASLVQRPAGWLSRIVLVNTGSEARAYSFRVVGEAGNTITTTAANMSGTIAAGSQKVISVDDVLASFTGSPRAAILVDVAAPGSEVEGIYQIVEPTKGSIDNTQMVRAGNP